MNTLPADQRFHALDALRAFALLLGVVFHATLSNVFPPTGEWAVGTAAPSMALWWFAYYSHSFRMEVFFLLAGFFGSLVVAKRGVAPYVRDRGKRVLLVFIVLLYPMKYLMNIVWFDGGLTIGWLQLSEKYSSLPLWQLAYEGLRIEPFENLSQWHLWFLYYLVWITALFMGVRWLLIASVERLGASEKADRCFSVALSARLAPLWMALLITPLLAGMTRYDVEAPGQGFALRPLTLLHYMFFFTIGWWLRRQSGLLTVFTQRWKPLIILGLALSVVAWCSELLRVSGHTSPALTWGTRFVVSLSTSLSVLGWIGLFVSVFSRPSARVRYVADSSYWVYLAHLPVVVALQVWLVAWDSVWLKLLAINVIAFTVLFASYHWLVRFTWAGRWLNGPRARVAVPAT